MSEPINSSIKALASHLAAEIMDQLPEGVANGLDFVSSPIIACQKVRQDEDAWLPVKREEDSDYDLFSSGDILAKAGEVTEILTNLAIEYPDGYEGKVEDKSGKARAGLTVFGGVIDNGYTGEHLVIIYNASKKDYLFPKGKAVAQLSIRRKNPDFTFEWVTRELKKSARGSAGFGSQGL